MTQTLNKPTDQRFTHSLVSWQQFKLIQEGFNNSPGIQLFYYLGEVEILVNKIDSSVVERGKKRG